MSVHKQVGDYLRAHRKKLGYSLAQVAQHIGTTRQYVSLMELGKQPVPDRILFELSSVLNFDPTEAFTLRGRIRPDVYDKFVEYQKQLISTVQVLDEAQKHFTAATDTD